MEINTDFWKRKEQRWGSISTYIANPDHWDQYWSIMWDQLRNRCGYRFAVEKWRIKNVLERPS